MNSVLEKYFLTKEKEIFKYAEEIMRMFSYTPVINYDSKTFKKIINIFFEDKYKILNPTFDRVSKYYNFEEEVDPEYKYILDSVIKCYELEEIEIENNEDIFFYSYILYFAMLIDKLKDTILIMPSKADFMVSIAKKVSNRFEYEKDESFDKYTNEIVQMIKENIKSHNKLNNAINKASNKDFYNEYILLSDEYRLYKLKYNTDIKGRNKYKEKDLNKIYKKQNIEDKLKIMSYGYSQIVLLRCLLNDMRKTVALEITKDFYSKKSNINAFLRLVTNKYTSDYSKVLIKAEEYEECENLEILKNNDIKIIIESDNFEDILKINFDENMVLLTSLSLINEHKSELTNKNIKYIKRVDETTYTSKELFITNKTEVDYE